ncbi:Tim44/TimA family putative adaptor protein, partial [Rhodoplanes roseus]|uniref:Tim44/TimA family putative adaptor protein n=1 Tax=Rhodoplanes roseus TaxID=29409 RepID=UPI001FE1C72F
LPPRGDAAAVRPIDTVETAPAAAVSPDQLKGIAAPGSPVAAGLEAIATADKGFDPPHFLAGARAAYEMIVTAFAEGDRRSLRNLLSKEVFDGFEAAIKDRESRGETAETRFVSIDTAEISAAELRGRIAQVTLRFVSQLISVTRDRAGAVVDGSDEKVTEVTDVWTFARDVSSRDPNWKLVATEAGH